MEAFAFALDVVFDEAIEVREALAILLATEEACTLLATEEVCALLATEEVCTPLAIEEFATLATEEAAELIELAG